MKPLAKPIAARTPRVAPGAQNARPFSSSEGLKPVGFAFAAVIAGLGKPEEKPQ